MEYGNKSQKIYCGKGRTIGQYGQIAISVCIDDIPESWIKTATNGKKYIALKVGQKQNIDQYGNSHYVEVDTYIPQAKREATAQSLKSDFGNFTGNEEVPF